MNKMTICKTCSKEIAKSARICPHCGAKNRGSFFKKVFGLLFIFIFAIIVVASLGNENNTSASNTMDIVKTGYLGNYKSVNVSKVLETNFPNHKWTNFTSKDKNIVQFNGEETINGVTRTMQIQFAVEKDNTLDLCQYLRHKKLNFLCNFSS